ncbi:hypothetical protein M5K25_013238 [Dendrobium thyrsiflorum]|uniref:DRBM domain-containing protein n=1 Tax=Dendrobium thyrsiflorum TaxID=117978 RepID=A0ABD0USJ6_DENTH
MGRLMVIPVATEFLISSKTFADVVEALIGVYYVEGGKNAVNHLMRWIGIQVEFNLQELEFVNPNAIPESILRVVDFDALEGITLYSLQIREFVKDVQEEVSKPGFNSFGLGDCKAPKVLGDIVESIAGTTFLDNDLDTSVVWKVFHPLLQPKVSTPETLPMHPVRELQERCQQQAEGLEYKASRMGNLATVQVFIDGVQIGAAQNPQKKMAQKLAARNVLAILKEKKERDKENELRKDGHNGEKKSNGQVFTRQALNDICLRRQWPMPHYRSWVDR